MSLDGVSLGLTALTTTACANPIVPATHLGIPRLSKFSQVSTCTATNYACSLPIDPVLNAEYTIRNDGVEALAIFPPPGTTSSATATIDGAATGAAYWLAPLCSVRMMCTAYVSGTGGTWFVVSLAGRTRVVRHITAAQTITKFESGHLFGINQTSGAYTITLPIPTTCFGCEFDFTVEVTAANIITIDSGAASSLVGGNNETIAGATASLAAVIGGNCRNLLIAATSPIGTNIRLYSDGIKWKVNSNCPVTAKVTFS